MSNVKFIRLERESTGSSLTLALPRSMLFGEARRWAEKNLPGWVVIHAAMEEIDLYL